MRKMRPAYWAIAATAALLLNACSPTATRAAAPSNPGSAPAAADASTARTNPQATIPSPRATSTSTTFGPDEIDFPPGVNPLTGQPVVDPSLLKIPAMLVSISNFPVTARPQAGLSFAPYVFEFSITEGQTRFLAAYYGEFPAPETPVTGDCAIRQGVFEQTDSLLGHRVWLDANQNGIQDPGEAGIGGICVSLFDGKGDLLQTTTTDSNGYYGFNVKAGQTYVLQFGIPAYLEFTKPNAGDGDHDSNVDPATGKTPPILLRVNDLSWDSGLVPNPTVGMPTPDPASTPKPQVGPVRSGRLLYAYIQRFFQDSCLLYAFASPEVLAKIPHCSFVAHEDSGGGSMLEIDRMKAIAEDNMRHNTSRPFDYASNLFSDRVPSGGYPASQIKVFFANLDQSGWSYDPLYEAYLHYVDTADKNAVGVLHADVERLTGRQIHFENVIVVMADTDVVSPTNLDIHLDEGNSGNAYLFRDGQMFPIQWSTRSGAYEQQTGFRRPIQFLNSDGSPAALRPGHTWVIIVTPFSLVQAQSNGVYLVRYAPPEGEAQ